jgi:hypothetical protein
MDTDLRTLLNKVAAGEVSPTDAAEQLDSAADTTPSAPTTGVTDAAAHPSGPASVARIVIRSEGAKLIVLADPNVAEAIAEGPHQFSREGNVLHVRTGEPNENGGFRMGGGMPRWLNWLPPGPGQRRVTVRVNPNVPVELDAMASDIEVSGLRRRFVARVNTSQFLVRDHEGSLDFSVMMSNSEVDVLLREGDSRITSDLSDVTVRLLPDSDVRVRATAKMGSVDFERSAFFAQKNADGFTASSDAVVGAGTASLSVEARMGAVKVRLP